MTEALTILLLLLFGRRSGSGGSPLGNFLSGILGPPDRQAAGIGGVTRPAAPGVDGTFRVQSPPLPRAAPAPTVSVPLNPNRTGGGGEVMIQRVNGIAWGGEVYADGGAWRAHVRPIYGPTFAMLPALLEAGEGSESTAREIRAKLSEEGETALRLHQLNLAYSAFTSIEAQNLLSSMALGGLVRAA